MNQATNPIEESPELKSSVDKVTDILTRPSEKPEESNLQESEQPPIEDADSGEEYIDEPSEEISEEYEEVLEDEEDSELYADEQADEDYEEDLQEQLYEVKIDGKVEQKTLDELTNGYSRQQSYTRKSQELAEQKKLFEAEKAMVNEDRQKYLDGLSRLESQIQQLDDKEPDWEQEYNLNPEEANRKRLDWQNYQQSKKNKLAEIQSERQKTLQRQQQEYVREHQAMLAVEAEKLLQEIPAWKDTKVAQRQQAKLKEFLTKRGVTEMEVNALAKANHISILYDAMLFNEGKKKVTKKRVNAKTGQTKVLRSGSRKPPKKTDKYKKTTSRLKKNGNWRDAQSAISMLLND